MLKTLNFNILVPTAYHFHKRFSKVASASSRQTNLARFLIEIALLEQRMLKYCPSNVAASALYFSRKILDTNSEWTQFYENLTSYTEQQLKPCVNDMKTLIKGIHQCLLKSVKKKFMLP